MAGCLRHNFVGVVRGVYRGLLRLPELRQHRQPLVVRHADGNLRHRVEFLASDPGVKRHVRVGECVIERMERLLYRLDAIRASQRAPGVDLLGKYSEFSVGPALRIG